MSMNEYRFIHEHAGKPSLMLLQAENEIDAMHHMGLFLGSPDFRLLSNDAVLDLGFIPAIDLSCITGSEVLTEVPYTAEGLLEVGKNHIRLVRAKPMSELDIAFNRALEEDQPRDAIVRKKNYLRNLTDDPGLVAACTSPESVRNFIDAAIANLPNI